MRTPHLAALRARNQVKWAQGMMCPSLIAARLGNPALWNCTHGKNPFALVLSFICSTSHRVHHTKKKRLFGRDLQL